MTQNDIEKSFSPIHLGDNTIILQDKRDFSISETCYISKGENPAKDRALGLPDCTRQFQMTYDEIKNSFTYNPIPGSINPTIRKQSPKPAPVQSDSPNVLNIPS